MKAVLCLVLAAGGAWELLAEEDGVRVERRPGKQEGLYQLRVTAHAPVEPEVLFATLWAHHEFTQFVPHLKHLEVLENDGKQKLVYQQVSMPVFDDRDYTLRVKAVRDEATRVYESRFETANALGPPPAEDHVRIPVIEGRWVVAPGEAGGCDVTYEVYSDPGVNLPGWLVRRAQQDAAPELVRAMIARAQKKKPSPAPLVQRKKG